MAIVLPDNKEDKKRAIEQLIRGEATTYKVGSKVYTVVPRKALRHQRSSYMSQYLAEELAHLYERDELLAAIEEACWDGRVEVTPEWTRFKAVDGGVIASYKRNPKPGKPNGGAI